MYVYAIFFGMHVGAGKNGLKGICRGWWFMHQCFVSLVLVNGSLF